LLFNSLEFFHLLIPTFVVYYLAPKQTWQLKIILVSSFIFYAFNEPWLLTLLVISIFINATASFKIAEKQSPKLWAWMGVVTNLGSLIFFKYFGLLAKTFFSTEYLKNDFGMSLLSIPLPIGISFFTFQGISLVISVYKGTKDLRLGEAIGFYQHLEKTAMFIAFFPQLIAGPIVQAKDFFFQIKPKKFKNIDWNYVFTNLILGYFLKCVVADNLKDQTSWIGYPFFSSLSSLDLIILLFAYSAQIFADFAGYSCIALGLSGAFGYRLPINFNWPYISQSFSEFWRRWHISLSTFLKDYLYIPLGGNKKGSVRTYFNIFVVMFLGGLWHGAAWSYAVWGLVHGLALAAERFFTSGKERKRGPVSRLLQTLFVFLYVTLAWLLFKLPDFQHVILYLKAIAGNFNAPLGKRIALVSTIYFVPVMCLHFYYLLSPFISSELKRAFRIFAIATMLFLIITNSGGPGAFIYFQF
jgi:alginate O-acetyltransferase complex protein AlgI